ncbi:MAG: AbrB/MazE/SpoVT family DNA-binding domain-containing protein [Acidobacteriota bacterium]|nr:MAG: AbrB/MazE/SpoVT family DNA-binding domain-containing protein [Acidobacteriota bacterium]
MITTIRKWGNSLGLRIPRNLAKDVQVEEGSSVRVSVRKGRLVVTPIKRKEYSLGELVADIKPSNLHEEMEFGAPSGREVW